MAIYKAPLRDMRFVLHELIDACGTFAELRKRYANAPANILQRAERERSRRGC